ncbi:hypothetical protein [[Actinomadura] parvosata]|uniref:hypothetical protein n=1 Tax=[Actinomadura] parvosata TaxID=1955412 RepID=UPI0012BBB05A|nr:hypothetical protein [Nonomuraea sp. ATCC 55076]
MTRIEHCLPPALAVIHWFEPSAAGSVTLRLSAEPVGGKQSLLYMADWSWRHRRPRK